eukprot:gene2384-3693_t
MNWFLIVVAIVVVAVTIIINIRLLRVYLDPEEKYQGGGYFPKTVVVFGLSLAAFVSLLLPFDVANRKDPTIRDDVGGELDLALLWQITLWTIIGMVVIVLPFALYYYEAWDPDQAGAKITREYTDTDASQFRIITTQLTSAFCWTGITLIIFIGILLLMYFAVGVNEAIIPYKGYKCLPETVELYTCPRLLTPGGEDCDDVSRLEAAGYSQACVKSSGDLHVDVSLFVATVAVLTCIGWILFVVFGGVGLSSLPLDMCYSFYENKLTAVTRESFAREKERIKAETRALLAVSDKLTERLKLNKPQQKKVSALQVCVEKLEKEHQRNQAYNQKSEFAKLSSPFIIYGRLLLGIFCVVWSAMWICHIIVYNTLDFHPLLNNMFTELDNTFSLFGVLAYGSFSFYLLWATVNGCMKVGINFLVFTIHPMKIGGTLMSSFVFNTILILLASVAAVSFCAMSFRQYAANTVVDTLYASYLQSSKTYVSHVSTHAPALSPNSCAVAGDCRRSGPRK